MTNADIAHAIRCMSSTHRARFMEDLATALAGEHYDPGDDEILDIVFTALLISRS